MMRLAMDEQIFAIQEFGGISRLFAELTRQYSKPGAIDVNLEPMHAPIVNRYILGNPELEQALDVWDAHSPWNALGRYFTRRRPSTPVDVLHSTFYLPHGLAGYPGARRIVTVHDMIPELMPKTRRRLDFITLKRRYVHTADHVICVSEATRQDLLRCYGPVAAPITVVHHGVDPAFTPNVPRWADLPDRYVLYVGNRGAYKDAAVLMDAFARVMKDEPETRLLFVGGGPFTRTERQRLETLGIDRVTDQRSLPDAEMPAAYGQALMCVFPSRFEGFGLPALEAMACGTPTILAAGSSLPEVGGDAAAYFTPGSTDELTQAMTNLVGDDVARSELSAAGIDRARQFTWERTAANTAAVYRATLEG
ncbi:MAG: glycosyltransferase [Actinobacteria bacterium]|uniref:Unannotated protein n=1 Tax=freshwater metagenome TaxID=449393 RepID=A0A6J7LY24_9ZZZZ|nr:glycosyltransferase [Actinomycetota bacterium]